MFLYSKTNNNIFLFLLFGLTLISIGFFIKANMISEVNKYRLKNLRYKKIKKMMNRL